MSTKRPSIAFCASPEVHRATGVSRTTRWRGVEAGTFPKPVNLTPSTIGW